MNENERNYKIKVTCRECKKEYTLKVRFEDYLLFDSPRRPLIQQVFPYLTPAERELLISHTCNDCWKKMFSSVEQMTMEVDNEEEA